MKAKYTLIGVNGNAYAIMAYVLKAMRKEGYTPQEGRAYADKAMSSDYHHLIAVSQEMLDELNNKQD